MASSSKVKLDAPDAFDGDDFDVDKLDALLNAEATALNREQEVSSIFRHTTLLEQS